MICNKNNCPIIKGFEIEFTGEDDEKQARKHILPLIKKLYKHGERVCKYGEREGKNG